MENLKIISNYHERPIIYYWELPQDVQDEFDWQTAETGNYFKYKGGYYTLSDFMKTDQFGDFWHSVVGDSAWTGVLLHRCENSDYVIVGWYLS